MRKKLFDTTLVGSSPQEALDFVANILESSTEYSIIGKDLKGKIVLFNEGARRLYGYEPEEIIGRATADILHTPDDVAAGVPARIMGEALRDGKWEGQVNRVKKNGERFIARMVMTPRHNLRGEPVGFLLISKDISQEIRLTREVEQSRASLAEKNAELETVLRAKDRFLASMSHELRTPLNAIIGFTGTLLMRLPGPLTGDQEKQLRTVQTSANHLLSLINDLLDLAKIGAGKVEIVKAPVNARGVIEEVVRTVQPFAQTKGLRLLVEASAADVTVQTDRRAFTQILINLVNNAIKFTERGQVEIKLRETEDGEDRWACVQIVDTGIGIRPEQQDRLFQAFEQGERASESQAGTGLGLHLSQKLAELLGGRIHLESEWGKGSTFSLRLPL
jgi:PAS domain S-box-containing protein